MLFIQPLSDPMRHLPGPPGTRLESHLQLAMDPALSVKTHVDWRTRFGQTFRFNGFGKHDLRLMSFDFRVIAHVLSSPTYEKPWQTRSFLGKLIGRGIFSMEGAAHKMQRRLIGPAFTHQSIKQMTPAFFRKADELCDRWRDIAAEQKSAESDRLVLKREVDDEPSKSSSVVIDVAHWISRASFDVIGLAGFNYDFHALRDESEEVYGAYRRMFDIADKGLGLREILELYFPILRKIWVNDDIKVTNESLRVIARSGKAIVAEKKVAFREAQINGNENKDLLTLLIKSNLSNDPSKQLTDQELLDQCSTFLLAGSDSVSVATSWCFHFLALHPEIQTQLRKELSAMRLASDDDLSDSSTDSGFQDCTSKTRWEAIESLSYLDAVVRETLRFCPPVHATIRVATRDDLIPISRPITLLNGETVGKDASGHVKIRKGTYVHIPIEGFSYSEDVWGADALEFNPNRWKGVQDWDSSKPGINNLLTFGYGPHSCVGYRFSIAEIKVFIATLLPHFEFRPAEGVKIAKFSTILTRPYVAGKWSEGTKLPLVVRELK
ncbi:cytochrome P450 [Flammula alnicola]|nr:cytochrome P450 [Flammula alnicola]